jgi:hypothetical protein
VEQLAASPDGKTLYVAAGGAIWSVPAAGGEIRRIHNGNSVSPDPDGTTLVVLVLDPPATRLLRVPVNGGAETEIPLRGPMQPGYAVEEGAVRNGKLVAPGSSNSWDWPPVLFDLATGRSTRIPLDYRTDFHRMVWASDGKILASAKGWHSSMWKFTPEKAQ